jgi:hypothetical protein
VTTALRRRFLLDPDVCYLNHGAFGAAPIPVFEAYQAWQRELEHQPTRFLTRSLEPALAAARRELADYVGAGEDDLTFVPNATTGIYNDRSDLERLLDALAEELESASTGRRTRSSRCQDEARAAGR